MKFTIKKIGKFELRELEISDAKELKKFSKQLPSNNRKSITDMLHNVEIPTLFDNRVNRTIFGKL